MGSDATVSESWEVPVEGKLDELLRRFGSDIGACAGEMIQPPVRDEFELAGVSITPLAHLREQAERCLCVATSKRSRFILFTFSSFLDDVFYNLSGDVPYGNQSHLCRQQFFIDLVSCLEEVSSALLADNYDQTLDVCEGMVSMYFDAIARIDSLIDQE